MLNLVVHYVEIGTEKCFIHADKQFYYELFKLSCQHLGSSKTTLYILINCNWSDCWREKYTLNVLMTQHATKTKRSRKIRINCFPSLDQRACSSSSSKKEVMWNFVSSESSLQSSEFTVTEKYYISSIIYIYYQLYITRTHNSCSLVTWEGNWCCD